MAKDYEGPVTPPRMVSPPEPPPVRRTLGFWHLPSAGLGQILLDDALRGIETISEEEAQSFGVLPEPIERSSPEGGASEDDSFTTERFAEQEVRENVTSLEPIRRPGMGPRR